MAEFWAALAGAVVGGILSALGAWWAFRLQRKHDADSLRLSLLAEVEAATKEARGEDGIDRYEVLFAKLDAGGSEPSNHFLKEAFRVDPSVTLPITFSAMGSIGLLGREEAAAVIHYFSAAVRFMKQAEVEFSDLADSTQRPKISAKLRPLYVKLDASRVALVDALGRKSPRPGR